MIGILAVLAVSFAAEPEPMLQFLTVKDSISLVAKLPAAAADSLPIGSLDQARGEAILRLSLLSAMGDPGPAILGAYSRNGTTLTFTPRFPLAAGCRFRAELLLDGKSSTVLEHTVPATPAVAPRVEAIFPTTDVVPANLLKFYIHFSHPMREGPALFDQIHVLDDTGKPVADPWRRTELWNADATRLTLWIHPGRIKQGVNLREEFGPVLEPNRKYTLVLDAKILDEDGQTLGKAVKKPFRTIDPVRTAIEIRNWKIEAPRTGTREPLTVEFPGPLDRLLLATSLTVRDSADKPIEGDTSIGPNERSWTFTPKAAWTKRSFSLHVSERLEDLAGNTPLRGFDFDKQAPAAPRPLMSREFRVK